MNSYHVYITTNPKKTVLYVGFTNDLGIRLVEHYQNLGNPKTFAGKYHCYNLLWFEEHHTATGGIEREKEIKKWRRQKKEALINDFNPEWRFLNNQVIEWPPEEGIFRD